MPRARLYRYLLLRMIKRAPTCERSETLVMPLGASSFRLTCRPDG